MNAGAANAIEQNANPDKSSIIVASIRLTPKTPKSRGGSRTRRAPPARAPLRRNEPELGVY